ncbi:MAG: helix-turn-helix domain-containing protein [Nanoarchaeota archaeon]
MNTAILKELGLTDGEIKTYFALFELQSSTTGPLCEKSGIPSSHIYAYLTRLKEKGLVSQSMRNSIKIFHPSPPETFIELQKDLKRKNDEKVKQQETELKELINAVSIRPVPSKERTTYRYFENVSGIKTLWSYLSETLSGLPKTSVIRIFSSDKESSNRFLAFYDEFHDIRLQQRLRYQLIIPPEMAAHGKKRSKQLAEVRILPLKNECTWGIVGGIFIMYTTTGKLPQAFLVDDEKFVQTFSNTYSALWKQAKPL